MKLVLNPLTGKYDYVGDASGTGSDAILISGKYSLVGTEFGAVAYTSAVTITLSGDYPTISDDIQIAFIKMRNAAGETSFILPNETVIISHVAGVITVAGLTVDPFAAGDSYEVALEGVVDPTVDYDVNALNVIQLNPPWGRYIADAVHVTEQDLTAAEVAFGADIDMTGFTHLGIKVTGDHNDSQDVVLKPYEIIGAVEFEIENAGVIQELDLWGTDTTDTNISYEMEVGNINTIRLKGIAGVLGVTAGDLTITISKIWRR